MSFSDNLHNAFVGSLVADAFSMPVHWYYDTRSLDHDYPELNFYTAPKNPHPNSILWRSKYTPENDEADILHGQAFYWGKWGIHYHQFLKPGENTLNYRLALELYRMVVQTGGYDQGLWVDIYKKLMRTPGWHEDTYAEEYHRNFFNRLATGYPVKYCGSDDIHIGGLAAVPALIAGLAQVEDLDEDRWVEIVKTHVELTHKSEAALLAAEGLSRMLIGLSQDRSLGKVIEKHGSAWTSVADLEELRTFEDRLIVGLQLSSACYLPDSFTASLFLSWKHRRDFEQAVKANALCGGDNCHRGAVVGSILGALQGIPTQALSGLQVRNQLEELKRSLMV